MTTKDCRYQAYSQWHNFLRFTLLSSIALLLVSSIVINSQAAQAAAVPGGNITNPVVRAVDIAKPAIVRIITSIGGHLTVHFTAALSANFPLSGGNYQLGVSGTGAFITSHGDILTADHVVKPPHEDLNDELFQVASADVATYINQNLNSTITYTPEMAYAEMSTGNFATNTSYDQPTSEVYLSTDYTGPLTPTSLKALPAGLHFPVTTIERDSPVNEKDTAIIHINMEDTPSIPLGDSDNVAQQDELTIIGYPGNADVSDKRIPTQELSSSVNKIYVSALKQTDAGAAVIQVGGNVEHGDSGGPALNSAGNIVGIVDFGLVSPNNPGSTAFLQSSNSAQALIQQLNLDVTPGPFEKAWRQAFTDYAATTPNHWHKADKGLQQLSTSYSLFLGVTPYLNYAETQASHEVVPPPAPQGPTIPWSAIIAIILVLVLLGAIALFYIIRKKRTTALQATAAYQSAIAPYPGTSYPGGAPYPVPSSAGWPAQGSQALPPVYGQQPNMPPVYGQQPNMPPVYGHWQQPNAYGQQPNMPPVYGQAYPQQVAANPANEPSQPEKQPAEEQAQQNPDPSAPWSQPATAIQPQHAPATPTPEQPATVIQPQQGTAPATPGSWSQPEKQTVIQPQQNFAAAASESWSQPNFPQPVKPQATPQPWEDFAPMTPGVTPWGQTSSSQSERQPFPTPRPTPTRWSQEDIGVPSAIPQEPFLPPANPALPKATEQDTPHQSPFLEK